MEVHTERRRKQRGRMRGQAEDEEAEGDRAEEDEGEDAEDAVCEAEQQPNFPSFLCVFQHPEMC